METQQKESKLHQTPWETADWTCTVYVVSPYRSFPLDRYDCTVVLTQRHRQTFSFCQSGSKESITRIKNNRKYHSAKKCVSVKVRAFVFFITSRLRQLRRGAWCCELSAWGLSVTAISVKACHGKACRVSARALPPSASPAAPPPLPPLLPLYGASAPPWQVPAASVSNDDSL